jgi:hypothetical protein
MFPSSRRPVLHHEDVGGELPALSQRALDEPVTAMIQRPKSVLSAGFNQGRGHTRGGQSVDISRSTEPEPASHTVMPRSASDTAHDSGGASDTD